MPATDSVEIDDARRAVLERVEPLPAVPVQLDHALGRVLAEDVVCAHDLPPFDGSAMDGYAVRAADVRNASAAAPVPLRVIGESRAGAPAQVELAPGAAIAISTGAQIPQGADAVVRLEHTRAQRDSDNDSDSHSDGEQVEVLEAVPAGAEIRRAGEDVRAGARVIERGARLGPAALGVLASLGHTRPLCSSRPRLAVLTTGDELLAPGTQGPPRQGMIRDSNSTSLAALATQAGAEATAAGRIGDEPGATRERIAAAAAAADVTVICGGVSVGSHDHVRPSLHALGAEQVFWGLALRPGHPTWFGTLAGKPVFGLPGNPVSAMVTFLLLVAPALQAMQGERARRASISAVLDDAYEKPAGRAHAVRCTLHAGADGWHARPTGPQGSHVLTSMLRADALAIVPSAVSSVAAGERVEVVPL
ncbi:MAG TPA: gephyrin-like molybdotransferase Glp [Solirubrobacteraceae bacterium]